MKHTQFNDPCCVPYANYPPKWLNDYAVTAFIAAFPVGKKKVSVPVYEMGVSTYEKYYGMTGLVDGRLIVLFGFFVHYSPGVKDGSFVVWTDTNAYAFPKLEDALTLLYTYSVAHAVPFLLSTHPNLPITALHVGLRVAPGKSWTLTPSTHTGEVVDIEPEVRGRTCFTILWHDKDGVEIGESRYMAEVHTGLVLSYSTNKSGINVPQS